MSVTILCSISNFSDYLTTGAQDIPLNNSHDDTIMQQCYTGMLTYRDHSLVDESPQYILYDYVNPTKLLWMADLSCSTVVINLSHHINLKISYLIYNCVVIFIDKPCMKTLNANIECLTTVDIDVFIL